MRKAITHDRLKQRLDFDRATGTFTWIACEDAGHEFNATWPGKRAGSVDKDGFFTVTVDGQKYHAHELAWFYITGEWPKVRGARVFQSGSAHAL